MTNQEAFEIALKHCLAQERKAVIDGLCAYSTSEGDCCAVGCLLTQSVREDLQQLIDRESLCGGWDDLVSEQNTRSELDDPWPEIAAARTELAGVDDDMLKEIQRAHDTDDYGRGTARERNLIRARFRNIAIHYRLTHPPELEPEPWQP